MKQYKIVFICKYLKSMNKLEIKKNIISKYKKDFFVIL